MFKTKGIRERFKAVQKKARDCIIPERSVELLMEAIDKEIAMIKAIKDMAGFRAWLDGERFDLSKIRGRK